MPIIIFIFSTLIRYFFSNAVPKTVKSPIAQKIIVENEKRYVIITFAFSEKSRMRRCRNWQTSKTKDLVLATACGFKSHPPHKKAGCTSGTSCFFIWFEDGT